MLGGRMIDWKKSAELNNMGTDKLKMRFAKYPNSNKCIISICDNCGLKRKGQFNQYRDLCRMCSIRTFEVREAARLKTIEQFSTQKARDDQSNRIIEHNKNHPETRKANSAAATKRWSDQTERDTQAERLINSEAHKSNIENQRGGIDIVQHHYIYDHADLSKNTVGITRSDHTSIHQLFIRIGYIVPHINMEENQ
jgi:hypothetical protein